MTDEGIIECRKKRVVRRISELWLVGVFLSHVGWVFEKVGRALVYGSISDRGFLSLPLCPIYASAIISVYLILGTPSRMRIFGKDLSLGRVKGRALYFLLAFVIASAIELCVGAFFGEIVGEPLWDYSERRLNLFGYVCLSYSLLWGVLVTFFMSTLWRRIDFAVRSLRDIPLYALGSASFAIITADLAFNVIYLLVFGCHFDFL